MSEYHRPIMVEEVLEGLDIRPGGIYFDGTAGGGGHSFAILASDPTVHLIATDKDEDAIKEVTQRLSPYAGRFKLYRTDFKNYQEVFSDAGVGQIDGYLLDLGISSHQIDTSSRGFAYMSDDAPLDMRMDTTVGVTAAQWLASAPENEIARVIHTLGEERFAKKIAKAIVQSREETPLTSTQQLAKLVAQVVPANKKDPTQNPATRTFQAIRIHINSELDELSLALEASMDLVEDGGRIAVITFHSLEDRIVKRFFDEKAHPEKSVDSRLPLRTSELPAPQLIDVKRILPTAQECASNPRARSAILRVATRTRSGRPA